MVLDIQGDFYTNSKDSVINKLRWSFYVLPANLTIERDLPFTTSAVQYFDILSGHSFEEIYLNSEAKISGTELSSEDYFIERLQFIATYVISQRCNMYSPNWTYPYLNPDGTSGGFVTDSVKINGNVYLKDGACLDGDTTIDALLGNIVIGESAWLFSSNVKNYASDTLTIEKSELRYSTLTNTTNDHGTVIRDSQLLFVTLQDSQITSSDLSDSEINQSVLSNVRMDDSTSSSFTNIQNSTVYDSTIQDSNVTESYITNSFLDGTSILGSHSYYCNLIGVGLVSKNCADNKITDR